MVGLGLNKANLLTIGRNTWQCFGLFHPKIPQHCRHRLPPICMSSVMYSNKETNQKPSAGVIIVGDEILKGHIQDINTSFLAKQLYGQGIIVKKVTIIPDDLSAISEAVSEFSEKYTHVITSGGIGPTHDDVTFEGVANAFKEKVFPHPVIVKLISEWFKTDDLKSPAMKMAHIPESAEVHFGENKELGVKSPYPLVSVKNVLIFPGVPHLLRNAFNMIGKKLLTHEGEKNFLQSQLYFSCDEVSIASKLNEAVQKHPSVTFGSYPDLFHSYYKTKVTLESLDKKEIDDAEKYLRSLVDENSIVDFVTDTISDPWNHFERLDSEIHQLFEDAQEVIGQAFQKYSLEEVCLCYNGGKDCLVVLHMSHAYLTKNFPGLRLQAIYITDRSGFPQVNEFVKQSINRYNLDCECLSVPMKEALFNLQEKRPLIKAVIMGTRRVDPNSNTLGLFSKTDGDWPNLMRISPIIDWRYDHVWRFIRQLYLPYCPLYDRGYTSLGNVENTLPNPTLKINHRDGRVGFLPAYQLKDISLERKGRLG